MRYQLVTPPAEEPVTLDEAKLHCRVDHDDEDFMFLGLIQAARESAESIGGRLLVTQAWKLYLDHLPACIEIEKRPVQSVTSVRYVDQDGVLQTLPQTDYMVDTSGLTPRILPAFGAVWPTPRCQPNAVEIEFVAGYGEPKDVPAKVRSWILLRVGELYANREGTIVGTSGMKMPFADSLLLEDRIGF